MISCKPRSTVVHVKIPQSSNLGCFQSLVRGHGSRLPPSPPLLSSLGGGGHRPALLRTEKPAQERYPGMKININPDTVVLHCLSVGCSDDHGRLLLALLAVLLHESDEPSDWAGLGDQGSHRHADAVGRRQRLKLFFVIPLISIV